MKHPTLTRWALYALGAFLFLAGSAWAIDVAARWLSWGPAR